MKIKFPCLGLVGSWLRGMMASALAGLLLACTPSASEWDGDAPWQGIFYPNDHLIRYNHVQAKGTHNSYHIVGNVLVTPEHRYNHPPLREQLEYQGVRQLELDLHLAADGTLQVFHLPVLDEGTTCRYFSQCLSEIATWSNAHPWHMPVLVWIELKDVLVEWTGGNYLPLTGHYDMVEEEITAAFKPHQLYLPRDLRRTYAGMGPSISQEGWPTLGEMRGKVIFALLDGGDHRRDYLSYIGTNPNAIMFVSALRGDWYNGAFYKHGDVLRGQTTVDWLAEEGMLITGTADYVEDTDEENHDRIAVGLQSATHYLSSNFVGDPDHHGRNYTLELPDGVPARCNPQVAPVLCRPWDIEHTPR